MHRINIHLSVVVVNYSKDNIRRILFYIPSIYSLYLIRLLLQGIIIEFLKVFELNKKNYVD